MLKYNDGRGESNIIQNQFTAYLVIAISRKKFRYQQGAKNRQYSELSLDLHEYLPELQTDPELLDNMPLMERLENFRLQHALEHMKERDLYIFLAKALGGRSFVEIAAKLDMEYKAVTSIYYRMIAKLKKELRSDDK